MSRRSFCWTLAGVLVAPGIAIAQASKVRQIGYLDVGARDEMREDRWDRVLREFGWVEGQNLHVERRRAKSLEGLEPLADELVRAKVEVIVADGPNPTRAAMLQQPPFPSFFG
jgi:hypothetical protein